MYYLVFAVLFFGFTIDDIVCGKMNRDWGFDDSSNWRVAGDGRHCTYAGFRSVRGLSLPSVDVLRHTSASVFFF